VSASRNVNSRPDRRGRVSEALVDNFAQLRPAKLAG
jgi:hypothetical protein